MRATTFLAAAGVAGVLLGGPRALPGQTREQADSGLRRLLHDYIALYHRDSLERWRALFLPSFTVAFTNADSSITERNLEQFVERQRQGFARSPDMSEVLENVAIEQRGSLASVWADFVFTADGQSRRGRLVMLCIRERAGWRIQSLLFSYHAGG
ncbi:MAG TPA: nuclear transport factor 2 family protein [Gemmatimonadales bacterium]|nr:nuclear transport factor 2 family protein [Gemmatimonadales bacterium]